MSLNNFWKCYIYGNLVLRDVVLSDFVLKLGYFVLGDSVLGVLFKGDFVLGTFVMVDSVPNPKRRQTAYILSVLLYISKIELA